METTKLSSKGRVVLPKSVRYEHGWVPGTEFEVESTADGVRLFESAEICIGVTALLEAAWVLESVYELSAADTVQLLRGLLGLPNVRVEDAGAVAAALIATERGLELADALYLVRAPEYAEFVTFDRALARVGRKIPSVAP